MKKTLCVFFMLFVGVAIAHAGQGKIVFTVVPFQNVTLNPNDSLQAAFSFAPYQQMFCYDANQQNNSGLALWHFGASLCGGAVSLLLTTNPSLFEGLQIDQSGIITIKNTQGVPVTYNCLFTY